MKTKLISLTSLILCSLIFSSCANINNDKGGEEGETKKDPNVNWSLFEESKKDEFFDYAVKTGVKISFTSTTLPASVPVGFGALKGDHAWSNTGSLNFGYIRSTEDNATYSYQYNVNNNTYIGDSQRYELSVFKSAGFLKSFNYFYEATKTSKYKGFKFVKRDTFLDRPVDVYKYDQDLGNVVITKTFYVEQTYGLTLYYKQTSTKTSEAEKTIEETTVTEILKGDDVITPTIALH